MTKTKVEAAPPFFSLLSKIPRSARAMTGGEAQERRARAMTGGEAQERRAQRPGGPSERAPPRAKARDSQWRTAGGTSSGQERVRRAEKNPRTAPGSLKTRGKATGRSGSAADACEAQSKEPGGAPCSTDSSSEVSDSTSEESKTALANDGQSSEWERSGDLRQNGTPDTGGCDHLPLPGDRLTSPPGFGQRSISPGDQRSFASLDSRLNFSSSLALCELTGEFTDGLHGELLREIDDLRSENEYLKNEMEELRSEMLEMRDIYMEEDVYQLQDLRQQLDQANKMCRILQYRLRKAERRSLRVAQTGHVDGELIRSLEHDVRVAKSVSLRLHSELEAMQKKSSRLEWENEELRERLQDLEVAKQVLQTEIDKSRESSLKRRSSLRSNPSRNEKRLSPQEDSADLKCQLHFAKEESALMCKKLTKMAVECESMREELAKYRLLYGDVDSSQAAAGTTNSAHTREAEVKVHLRLVEEEATLLSRRIVELEVENRGLRAEMSEMRERAGGGQEDEDEVMEGGVDGLCLPASIIVEENINVEMSNRHQRYEDETGSEDCPLSPILREGPVGGERDPLEDQEKSAENAVCAISPQSEPVCSLSLKDQEAVLAIRDQALLVKSTIQLLRGPVKNGLSANSNPNISDISYLNKIEVDSHCKSHPWLLDPMLSPLTNGLEVLQAQLCALVTKLEVLLNSEPTDHEPKSMHSDTNEVQVLEKVPQQCPTEETTCLSSTSEEHTCCQDSLKLLTLQLRWFLQQWRQGERPTEDSKSLFEMGFKKDLYLRLEAELQDSWKTCGSPDNCPKKHHRQMSSALFSNLKAALEDLGLELLEEYQASQRAAQQYAQAKAAWMVESTELKSIIDRLENTSGRVGIKGSHDLKMALQKDHVEKLQHLLAESYAGVMDMTRRLKVCEQNWMCERQELLKHLSQVHLDWDKENKTMQSHEIKTPQEGGETKRTNAKVGPSAQVSNKNWLYISREAAHMHREDPCKTWDCPIMPPSFPGLNVKQEAAQKCHTAPEKTKLRIYYSPPSARRIHLSALTKEDPDECQQFQERQEQNYHFSSSQQIKRDSVYEDWLGTLPLECHSATDQGPIAATTFTSFSGFQLHEIQSPSHLPFHLEVSANMSDDMKEMTASVLHSSHPSTPERRRGRDSGCPMVAMISTGTQTHILPKVSSVGLQTESPRSVYGGKHWSPRVTSFVSGRAQPISTSLERMPGPSERLPPYSSSPKLQRRHSTSSPFPPTSSSSNSSNSSSTCTSSTLSSSSSLTASSKLEASKERGLWSISQCSSGSSTWGRSNTARPSSTSGVNTDKPTARKSAGFHKYGLVQEFFRNVCGRGEKPNQVREKAPVIRKELSSARLKKAESPPSRIPTVPLVRSDSVTKIVNRRFMKQGQKDEPGPGQTQAQSQSQSQAKTPISKDKGLSAVTLEDGSCDCSSRTLASCFARASRTNIHHAHGRCKLRPHECHKAAGGKRDLLPQ